MTISEIKEAVNNGEQFTNESAGWFTLSKPECNRRIIVFDNGDELEYRSYKTIDSYCRRIALLIKRGY